MTVTRYRQHVRVAHPSYSGMLGGLVWAAALVISHPRLAEQGESGMTSISWAPRLCW